jgi:hypothetical protein
VSAGTDRDDGDRARCGRTRNATSALEFNRAQRKPCACDGVRLLIRTMKKITEVAGDSGTELRDRGRSVKLRVLDIARAARSRAKQSSEKLKRA